jgi:choline kinase
VIKYREYVDGRYGGKKDVNGRLVFTHSDTQYGNILRVKPDDEKSPLLQPANQHKQLIVIDFEYAGANMIGYEFANHFNEWAYNYHDPVLSWACNHKRYPLPDEQKRFVKAYVDHRPKIQSNSATPQLIASDSNLSSGPSTPLAQPTTNASSSSIVEFMLDARVPPGGWSANERANEEQSEQRVRELLEETRLWRPASHVAWISWGIVQAKIPGLDVSFTEDDVSPDEFNYLSYAQDRTLYFWADLVQLGLVKKADLPEKVQAGLKFVDY